MVKRVRVPSLRHVQEKDEIVCKIEAMYKEGVSSYDIAEKLNVRPKYCRDVLIKLGYVEKSYAVLDADKRDKIKEMHRNGMRVSDICRVENLAISTVSSIVSPIYLPDDTVAQVLHLLKKGQSLRLVSTELNVPLHTVRKISIQHCIHKGADRNDNTILATCIYYKMKYPSYTNLEIYNLVADKNGFKLSPNRKIHIINSMDSLHETAITLAKLMIENKIV